MSIFDRFSSKLSNNNSNDPKVETWELIASGTVQGVGFRWSVQTLAQSCKLHGTVQNNPDLTVTIRLQGSKDEINHFIELLPSQLSPFAHLEKIETNSLGKLAKMHGFHVLY